MRIHHVQLMIERGREADALSFYRDLLGLTRIDRPADMPNSEGIWFQLLGGELHLGVQDELPFETRAHVAFVVDELDGISTKLSEAGARTKASNALAGLRRVHVWDPFGNRLELMGE